MYHVVVEFKTNIVEVDFKYLSQAKDCIQQAIKFNEFVIAQVKEEEDE